MRVTINKITNYKKNIAMPKIFEKRKKERKKERKRVKGVLHNKIKSH